MAKRPIRKLVVKIPKPRKDGECLRDCPLFCDSRCLLCRFAELDIGKYGFFPGKGCPWFKEECSGN